MSEQIVDVTASQVAKRGTGRLVSQEFKRTVLAIVNVLCSTHVEVNCQCGVPTEMSR